LPLELKLVVDSACDQLEAGLRDGQLPDCEALAQRMPAPCQRVFRRESERLIREYQQAPTAAGPGGSAAPGFRLQAGDRVGRFELIQELGAGGFGTVWLAADPAPRRRVALKVFFPRVGGDVAIDRFRRETNAMARLDHPGIVRIFECGKSGRHLYIVLEYIEGRTLEETVERDSAIPPRVAVNWVLEVARALGHAHERSVIHRDIKPSNILIDAGGRVKLTDFGLARDLTCLTAVTTEGSLLGSFGYMSPEQATGHGDTAGAATDLWSLGVLLYRLLSGRLPFGGLDRTVLERIIHEDPLPLRAGDRPVDAPLETIVLKCLQKEPHLRYRTAEELAADLERWRDGQPIRARRPGPLRRLKRLLLRRLGPIAITGMLLVSLLSGVGGLVAWRVRHVAELDRRVSGIAGGFGNPGPADGELDPRLRAAIRDSAANSPERFRLLKALSKPSPGEFGELREGLLRVPAAEFEGTLARVRDLEGRAAEPAIAGVLRDHWRRFVVREGIGEAGAREVVRGILQESEGEFRGWLDRVPGDRSLLSREAARQFEAESEEVIRNRLFEMIVRWSSSPEVMLATLFRYGRAEDAGRIHGLALEQEEVLVAFRKLRANPGESDSALAILTGLRLDPSESALREAMDHPQELIRRQVLLGLAKAGVEPARLVEFLRGTPDRRGFAGALIALGDYPVEAWNDKWSEFSPRLEGFLRDADPELSAAAIWLTVKLENPADGRRAILARLPRMTPSEAAKGGRRWFVDPFGQRFVRLGEERGKATVRVVYLADTETAWKDWVAIDPPMSEPVFPSGIEGPAHLVSPEEAVRFLSKRSDTIKANGGGLYRLPSAAEWDDALRRGKDLVGTEASISFGWLGLRRPPPATAGCLPPNRLGAYDMVGLVSEICIGDGPSDFVAKGLCYKSNPLDRVGNSLPLPERAASPQLGFRSVVDVSVPLSKEDR
jgi:hypothetical protein